MKKLFYLAIALILWKATINLQSNGTVTISRMIEALKDAVTKW